MTTLDEVLARVQAQRGQIESLASLTAGIKKKLDEALGGELTPSQQMRVDAIFNELNTNTGKIVDAINVNDDDPNTPPQDLVETRTTVTSSNAHSTVGEAVVLSALVEDADDRIPTGMVSFAVDGTEVGSGTLDADAVAVFTVSNLTEGEHKVTASYAGNTEFAASVSEELVQTVVASA